MRASEIIATRVDVLRRVGLEVPTGRSAVGIAVELYRQCGIDVEIAGRTIYVEVGPVFALPVQQALERFSGIRGFNEWE